MLLKKILDRYLESFRGLPRAAWLLSLVVLVNYAGGMVIFFLSLYLTVEKGLSVTTAGKIISLWGFGSLVGSYLGGWLADRLGSKRVQTGSLILTAGGYVILGYLPTLESIGVAVCFLAVVANAFRPANITAFSELCGGESGPRGFALMRLAVNLGFSIGPALGGILAMYNYQYLFWANGLSSLAAAVVLNVVLKDNLIPHKEAQNPETAQSPWKDFLLLRFLGILLVVGILFFQIFGTWSLYLRQVRGFPENRIGFLMTINALMIVFFEMQLIHRIEKKEPLRLMALGAFLNSAGFAMLPLMKNYTFVALSVMLWTIGEMLIFPLAGAFIESRSSSGNSGSYMGLFTLTFSLSMMIGPVLGTWVYNHFGPNVLWYGAGVVGMLAGIGFLNMRRYSEKKELASDIETSRILDIHEV